MPEMSFEWFPSSDKHVNEGLINQTSLRVAPAMNRINCMPSKDL